MHRTDKPACYCLLTSLTTNSRFVQSPAKSPDRMDDVYLDGHVAGIYVHSASVESTAHELQRIGDDLQSKNMIWKKRRKIQNCAWNCSVILGVSAVAAVLIYRHFQ